MACISCGTQDIGYRIEAPDGSTAGEMCKDCVEEEIEPYTGDGFCAFCDTKGGYHLNELVHSPGEEDRSDELKQDAVVYEGFLCEEHFEELAA